MQNITIVMLFLTLITTTRSNAITVINQSSGSFIIDCHDRSGKHEFRLAPEGTFIQKFDFDFVLAKPTQYIETDAHRLTITIRNPYHPSGRFTHIDNHVETTINIKDVDQISIVAIPGDLYSNAVCHFLIIKNHIKTTLNSPDSAIDRQSPEAISYTTEPIKYYKLSDILGIITQMDLDDSSIAAHQYHAVTELQAFEHSLSNSSSASFD